MDLTKQTGVFHHLLMLEKAETAQLRHIHQQEQTENLKATIATLRSKRDAIRAETSAIKSLKDKMDQGLLVEDIESADLIPLELSLLTSCHMQIKDLQNAHNLIAGYSVVDSKQGKGLSVAFHTAYEGVCLETYNVELDLIRMQVIRHNIPQCISLEKLAKEILPTDLKGFLQTLSQHLNALAGRRQQIALIQEFQTVELIERNHLCSFLALALRVQGESDATVLCALEYGDLTRCLPTKVTIEAENKTLIESPQWKKNQVLLTQFPVHTALLTMRKNGDI